MGTHDDVTSTTDACSPLTVDLTGQAALVRRGGLQLLPSRPATSRLPVPPQMVLYNNAAGALNATVAGTPPITIPVVGITAAQGAALDAAIAGGPTTLSWTAERRRLPLRHRWPDLRLQLLRHGRRPEHQAADRRAGGRHPVGLPAGAGRRGRALGHLDVGSPHVAGGVALLLRSKPNLRPAAVQSRIQNTADPKNWSGNPDLGLLDHSLPPGCAGMLDVVGAVTATATVSPSQISTGESASGSYLQKITVRNLSTVAGHLHAGPRVRAWRHGPEPDRQRGRRMRPPATSTHRPR
jgi:minor extracellular serine protease Vpr